MAALPNVVPGAGAAALVDADGWVTVGTKGLRQRRLAPVGGEAEADGAAAAGAASGGFALLEGLDEEEEEEEEGEVATEEVLPEEVASVDGGAAGAPEERAEGGAGGSAASAATSGPAKPTLSLPGRRKRLLDDSILRCPHRSLIADVFALHRRRAAAGAGGRGGGVPARVEEIKASGCRRACLCCVSSVVLALDPTQVSAMLRSPIYFGWPLDG